MRFLTAHLAALGLLLLGLGMILVVAGVLVGPLFLPGTWSILLGMLAFAADGVIRVIRASGDAVEA